ncbi:MAG: SLAC1 anion channel family protein [Gammaproteobacteria bacterium]
MNQSASIPPTDGHGRLQHFPISFFAIVMGLCGITIAYQRAESVLQLPVHISGYLLTAAGVVFVVLATLYLLKLARYSSAVVKDLHHPVRLSFFPTISISLILLSIGTLHVAPQLSFWLWCMGTAVHMIFTLYIMDVWIHHQHFEIHHINPAWFIPVVGNMLVPIAGVHHGFTEISWFFFSVGLLFWLVLLTIIFYRVTFHNPLPQRLVPTFFILIAPPAVGFISYVNLVGNVDNFARVLYYTGLFLTILLATQYFRFAKLKFFLSWWAYSFPLAAITIASVLMYGHSGLVLYWAVSVLLLAVLTLIITILVYKTLQGIARREICVEEG